MRRGRLTPIHRIYNRAIADELIARNIRLPFDLSHPWDVEWAGHPNWYFLISKFSIPWLSRAERFAVVPPAVFVDDFLAGPGRDSLSAAGVPLPASDKQRHGLCRPPSQAAFLICGEGNRVRAVAWRVWRPSPPKSGRTTWCNSGCVSSRLLIRRSELTQAEIRILYMWPDGGVLTPALSLVRLGRGKMMGVDHNRNQEWVGGSAAFYI